MAGKESDKPRRSRKSDEGEHSNRSENRGEKPLKSTPKYFSFGPPREGGDEKRPAKKEFDREKTSPSRGREFTKKREGFSETRSRKPSEHKEERNFSRDDNEKPRARKSNFSNENEGFKERRTRKSSDFSSERKFSREDSDRPKTRRSEFSKEGDGFKETRGRKTSSYGAERKFSREDTDRPKTRRSEFSKEGDGFKETRGRKTSSYGAERKFSAENGEKDKRPRRPRTDESQPDKAPSTRYRRSDDAKPTFERNPSRGGFEERKPTKRSYTRSDRSDESKDIKRTERFKSDGEWLDPEQFQDELNKKKHSRGKKGQYSDGFVPDFVPKQKAVFSKGKKESNPTLESVDGKIRLNKYIANAGICSRREADDLILSGAVKVNGVVVNTLGFRVSPIDKIQYGDQTLSREKKQYVLLNKPKDYITTANDPEGRKTVMELVREACRERLYPVGRLDRATTGLLLLTNDGELAKRLTHPSHEMRKVYHVTLDKNLQAVDLKRIAEGLVLEDGPAYVDEISWASTESKKEIGVVLHSGKNRIVRRIFEHLGYDVVKLDRTGLAGLTKKNLPRGKFRFLTEKEVIMLRMG
jgi:23S rRNA pseudouridine2605 synthase